MIYAAYIEFIVLKHINCSYRLHANPCELSISATPDAFSVSMKILKARSKGPKTGRKKNRNP